MHKRFVDRLHTEDIPVVKSGVGRLLETGSVVLSGAAAELAQTEEVRRAYLGG